MDSHDINGRVGIFVADKLIRVYQEVAGLLGITDPVWDRPLNQGRKLI
jgi:hypothetical protein